MSIVSSVDLPTLRRVLTALLLALTLLAAVFRRTPPTEPLRPAHTVVLLLTPGLSFADAADLAPFRDASTGSGPVRGVMTTRSPADSGPSAEPLLLAARAIGTGDRTSNVSSSAKTLGDALRQAGVHTLPLTDSDPAAAAILGMPRPDPLQSDIPRWRQNQGSLPDGYVTAPRSFARAVAKAVRAAGEPGEPPTLLVATFDDLYRDDQYAPFALPSATRAQRRGSLFHLGVALDRLTARDSPDRLTGDVALLAVTPLPSLDARQRGERLGPVAVWRPSDGTGQSAPALLTSPSTRSTPGLIAGTDVAATVTSLLGLAPEKAVVGAGRAARAIPDDGRLPRRIAAWDAQACAQASLIYVPWALSALLLLAAFLARRGLPRPAFAVLVATLLYPVSLIACAALPIIDNALLFYAAAALPSLMGAGLSLTLPGVLPRRRGILGGIALATALLILGDTLTGGYLLAHTPLSYSVMEAARFYGIGNEAAGVLIGAALLAAVLLFDDDPVALGLFGAAVCLTLSLPMLGAKAGSLIGAITGFGVAMGARRIVSTTDAADSRRVARLLLAAFGASILVLAALAVWDATRSPDAQTHMGAAVAGARLHGVAALFATATRKARMDAHLFVSSPWAVLLAVELGLLLVCLRQKSATPENDSWRVRLLPLGAAGICLLFLNDAGVLGAANCLLFAAAQALTHLRPRSETDAKIIDATAQP